MSRYVTDTHALYWHLTQNERLSPTAHRIFCDADAGRCQIVIPSIILVEMVYLIEKGRLDAIYLQQIFALLDVVNGSYVMIHDVVAATYKGDYVIALVFDDGAYGDVDFSPFVAQHGVFARFNDVNVFRNFVINEDMGVLTWDDEIDIAPETLYALATGNELPDWMDTA